MKFIKNRRDAGLFRGVRFGTGYKQEAHAEEGGNDLIAMLHGVELHSFIAMVLARPGPFVVSKFRTSSEKIDRKRSFDAHSSLSRKAWAIESVEIQ